MRFGRYQLERRVARGDVTEVFLARQPEGEGSASLAVVRRVLPARAANAEFVERFLEEARLAARLDHPNIVQIDDVGEIDGAYFVATEYVPGASLFDLVGRAGGPLSLEVALYMTAEVCAGLQFAHALAGPDGTPLGAVHGDLSPKNVLASVDGVVKVVDFGLSRAWARFGAAPPSGVPGAYAHLAPELVAGGVLDRRTDVYACGALLYYLVTGRPAFPEATHASALIGRAGGPVPPRQVAEDVPEEVEAIVLQAMAAEPKDRFATCGAMRRRVTDAAEGLWVTLAPEPVAALVRQRFPEVLAAAEGRGPLPGELLTAQTWAEARGEAAPTVDEEAAAQVVSTVVQVAPEPAAATVVGEPAGAPPRTLLQPGAVGAVDTSRAPLAAMPPSPPTMAVEGAPPPRLVQAAAATVASVPGQDDGATMALGTADLEPVVVKRGGRGSVIALVVVAAALLLGGIGAGAAWLLTSDRTEAELPPSLAELLPEQPGPAGPAKAVPVMPSAPLPAPLTGPSSDIDVKPEEGAPVAVALSAPVDAGSADAVALAEPLPEEPGPSKVASPEPGGHDDEDRPRGTGYLSVLTTPYSKVYMDGRLLGTTPILKRAVPVGRHGLRFVSPQAGTKRVTVTIQRNRLTQVRQSLWPANRGR